MGRPSKLCPGCPDSRVNRNFTVQVCDSCDERACIKHIAWYTHSIRGESWYCSKCIRMDKKKVAKKKEQNG